MHLAPTANILAAKFDEKDWPFVLRFPFDGQDLSLTLIDLDNRARPDDRVHREVGNSDDPIDAVTEIQMLDEADRDFSHISTSFDSRLVRSRRTASLDWSGTTFVSSSCSASAASCVLGGANIAWSRPKSLRCSPKNAKMFDQCVWQIAPTRSKRTDCHKELV
jgi:hypothetical protein